MKAENTASRFVIKPAKSLLILTVCLAGTISGLLLLMPILFWVKTVALLLIVVLAYVEITKFASARDNIVIYQPTADRWIVNGNSAYLRPSQWVTRSLIVMYFKGEEGNKLIQVVPADSMPSEQHRQLRKLLISAL